jgi:hypothetical protein
MSVEAETAKKILDNLSNDEIIELLRKLIGELLESKTVEKAQASSLALPTVPTVPTVPTDYSTPRLKFLDILNIIHLDKLNIIHLDKEPEAIFWVINKQMVLAPININLRGRFNGDSFVGQCVDNGKLYLYRNFNGKIYKIDRIAFSSKQIEETGFITPVTEEGEKFYYSAEDDKDNIYIGVITRDGKTIWEKEITTRNQLGPYRILLADNCPSEVEVHERQDCIVFIEPNERLKYFSIEDGNLVGRSLYVSLTWSIDMQYLAEKKLFYHKCGNDAIGYINGNNELVGYDKFDDCYLKQGQFEQGLMAIKSNESTTTTTV